MANLQPQIINISKCDYQQLQTSQNVNLSDTIHVIMKEHAISNRLAKEIKHEF